ncbi:hypothetical protein GC175_17090 [bacterium]|nr:hypothetical protein [bacterium]
MIEKIGRVRTLQALRAPAQRAVSRVVRFMADYPPVPATSKYIRGGPDSERLGQSWNEEVKVSDSQLEARAGNNASYGPWVQSAEWQAWMHRGRWQTDEDAVETLSPVIEADFTRTIDDLLR